MLLVCGMWHRRPGRVGTARLLVGSSGVLIAGKIEGAERRCTSHANDTLALHNM